MAALVKAGDQAELAALADEAALAKQAALDASAASTLYRDGFGNVIPDIAEHWRQKLGAELARRFVATFAASVATHHGWQVEHDGDYRGGTIT